jgi:four helix bundle protein
MNIPDLKFQVRDQPHSAMPTYQRFEDLPVWRSSADLYDHTDDFIDRAPPRLRPSFRDQLERAALSVSNNIAEGFERGTTNELLAFLYIARGSAGEVRSMLLVAARRPYLSNFKSEISDLIRLAESCSRQLRAWAGSLQNSGIAGPRHLNDKARADYGKRRARETGAAQFSQTLSQHLPPDHPLHPQNQPGQPPGV